MRENKIEIRDIWLLAAAVLALGLAAYLRLSGLDSRSITHPEMYTPGIHMPAGISEPHERLTLTQVLTGSLASETHPPAYYVFMLVWVRCFGTSLATIRVPSALFGIGAVPLLFWLGMLVGDRTSGTLAAVLTAVNGFNVFFSQIAKMYALSCLLGLLSTILLLRAAKHAGRGKINLWLYAIATLTGLATHHFFWALFAVQVLWSALNSLECRRGLPAVVRTQLLVLILGSPLIAIAAYQSGMPVLPPGEKLSSFLSRYFEFGFLWPPNIDSGWVFMSGLFLLSVLLLGMGAIRLGNSSREILLRDEGGPSRGVLFAATALAVLAILTIVVMAEIFAKPQPFPSLRLTGELSVLPVALLGFAVWLERRCRPSGCKSPAVDARSGQILIVMLALLPLVPLAVTGLHKPVYNERGALLLTPYLLFVIAAGITTLAQSWWTASCIGVILIGLHTASINSYRTFTTDPADYHKLALALSSRVQQGDMIFLRKSWSATPILYYLPEDKYQLIGSGYGQACRRAPNARVWAVAIYEHDIFDPMRQALTEYQPVQTVEIPYAKAVLYIRKKP